MADVTNDPESAVLGDMLDSPEAGRKVVRGGALRVVGFVAGVGASVVSAALVTRHLGPADYGRYQTVVALVMIVQAVTDLGMSALGLREYAQRTGDDRERFMRVLLGMRFAMTMVGIAVAMGAAVVLGYDHTMVIGAGLMGFGLMLAVFAGTVGIPIAAELRMGVVTGLDVMRQVLTAAGLVALVLLGAGLAPLLAVTIPANALLALATVAFLRPGQKTLRPSFDRARWVLLVRPTIAFGLATAVGTLYVYAALVLTSLVTTQFQTGLFGASFRVYAIVAAVPGVLVTTAFPVLSRAARDDRVRLQYATQRLFEGTAILGGAALVGCVLGASAIIAVVAGPQYEGAIPVLRVQGVALGLTFLISTWGFTLLALHRHRTMLIANAISLVASTVTVLLLARTYGAEGAAWATLIGEGLLAAGYLYGLRRGEDGVRPEPGRAIRVVPAVAVGLAAALLPLPTVARTAVGLVAYAVVLLIVRAVPDEVLEHLPRRVARLGGVS